MTVGVAAPGYSRVPLFAMAALAVGTIAIVGVARLSGVAPVQVRPAPVAISADVRFEDAADGGVRVRDARTGALIETLAPGTNAFVRTVMRGLVQVRKGAGVGEDIPFRIERTVDAHLSLSDPATGRRIELDPFGQLNANAFARLMPASRGS